MPVTETYILAHWRMNVTKWWGQLNFESIFRAYHSSEDNWYQDIWYPDKLWAYLQILSQFWGYLRIGSKFSWPHHFGTFLRQCFGASFVALRALVREIIPNAIPYPATQIPTWPRSDFHRLFDSSFAPSALSLRLNSWSHAWHHADEGNAIYLFFA